MEEKIRNLTSDTLASLVVAVSNLTGPKMSVEDMRTINSLSRDIYKIGEEKSREAWPSIYFDAVGKAK